MVFRFHPANDGKVVDPAENIQETDKYHSLEFVHCSDWLFPPNFGRFLIRTKLDFGRFSASVHAALDCNLHCIFFIDKWACGSSRLTNEIYI